MLEIVRMQLRHMLGGRRKWLVAICLALPVLLSLAQESAGGFEALQRELDRERSMAALAAGEIPPTAQRLTWAGEDREFVDGRLRLTSDGLRFRDRPLDARVVLVINDGYLVARNGELWIDPTKEGRRQGFRIRVIDLRHATLADNPAAIPDMETIYAIYLFLIFPQAICLLLALFYGTSVLGEELDGKTLTYLFTRPLPRWQFVVGKYVAIIGALTLPTGLSVLASWLILGAPGGAALLLAILVGSVGALLAYNALFVLFGFVLPRRAMIVALLYGVFFELILSFVPALVNEITVTYYLRSLVVAMLDLEIPREIARVVGGASPAGAVLALGAIVAVSLSGASILASRREYVVKDTA